MATDSNCEPPCINYSLNDVDDLPEYIYGQYDTCIKAGDCVTAPLLRNDGNPFLTLFDATEKSADEIGAQNAIYTKQQTDFLADYAATVTQAGNLNWDESGTLASSETVEADNNFTYPNLTASCVFLHPDSDEHGYAGTGNTVCLMDYMKEHLTEYNKSLCIAIPNHDSNTATICYDDKYSDNTNHPKASDRNEYENYQNSIQEGEGSATEARYSQNDWDEYKQILNQETKELQLKKDFKKDYNDNIFEIIVTSMGIIAIMYLIKKY